MHGCLKFLGWLALLVVLLVIDHTLPELSGWLLACGLIGVGLGLLRSTRQTHKEAAHA